ncbi:hypothetical protein OSCI_520016 [Kamptonema sp. PCC 6506]|nr:hypothetical protein OSCI_520016 [Kamptonema sp. PCC 6506]
MLDRLFFLGSIPILYEERKRPFPPTSLSYEGMGKFLSLFFCCDLPQDVQVAIAKVVRTF